MDSTIEQAQRIKNYATTAKSQVNYLEDGHYVKKTSVEATLGAMVNTASSLETNLYALKASISNAKSANETRELNFKATSGSAKLQIDAITAKLDELEEKTQDTTQQFKKIKSFIGEARLLEDEMGNDLAETKSLLADLLESMGKIRKYSPEMLANPVIQEHSNIYTSPNPLSSLAPSVIAIVIMFTALLLTPLSVVSERRQGVTARLRSMPVPQTGLLAGKIAGQTAIVFIECLFLTAFAVAGFGLAINGNYFESAIASIIAILGFVSIGFFASRFIRTEQTAILSSLIISLPLLFLSGIMLPLEFMPAQLAFIKAVNPLSITTSLLANTMAKSLPLSSSIPQITAILIASAALIAIAIAKDSKE